MALQSEGAAPLVGEAYTEIFGHKSEEFYDDETEEEEIDLEDGEIVDSDNEAGQVEEAEDDGNETEIVDEDEILEAENKTSSKLPVEEKQRKAPPENDFAVSEKYKKLESKERHEKKREKHYEAREHKRRSKYIDPDQLSDSNDGEDKKASKSWYQRSRKKSSSHDDCLDYRKELSMYSTSPKNSPERESRSKKKRSAAALSKLKAKKNAAKRAKMRLMDPKRGKTVRRHMIKRPCKFYLEGGCSKGENCIFLHIRNDRKRELCRYYLNGHCTKGKQCVFMHEDFPCKFYHTGAECYSGDKCRFSHEPLNDETKKLLQECLKGYNDDYNDRRKRQKSRSPEPPSKRPCLLGSPPRHIREAEETKRWQEEMIHLQKEKSTKAFQIHLNDNDSPNDTKSSSPPRNMRPNFYVDTMQSPNKPGGESQNPPAKQNSNNNAQGENNFEGPGGNRNFNEHNNPNFMPLGPGAGNPNFANVRPGGNSNFNPIMGPAMNPNFVNMRPGGNRNFGNMGPRGNPNFGNMRPGMPPNFPMMGPPPGPNPNFIGRGPGPGFGNRRPIMNPNFAHPPPFFHPGQDGNDMRPPNFNRMNMPRNDFPHPMQNTDFGESKAVVYEDLMENNGSNYMDPDDDENERGGNTPPSSDNFDPKSPSQTQETSSGGNSPNEDKEQSMEEEPIVIPRSLPRRQQELFLRIQRHQKSKSAEDSSDNPDAAEGEGATPTSAEPAVSQKDEEENYEDKAWMSSDEDDDDGDKPLTAVLKKLGQAPPPKPKEIPPLIPQLDLSQMLSNIMQKTNVNNKTNIQNQEQGKFWQNILSGAALATKSASTANVAANNATETNKRRTLLPEPKPAQSKATKETRDPRLKSRDPRTATNKATPLVPKTSQDQPLKPAQPPPPILPLEPLTTTLHHRRDLNSFVPSHVSAVVVDGLQGNVPYKLHVVSCKPLNYSLYVQASHSDPKLLNDPRLRKLISMEPKSTLNFGNILDPSTASTLPDLAIFNPLPRQENPVSSDLSSQSSTTNVPQQVPEVKVKPQSNDPRTKRAEQRRPSASTTPPLSPVEEKVSPIVPPVAASHLPRGMADPRMAKLHKPLDPRRNRLSLDSTNKTNPTDKQPTSETSDTNEDDIHTSMEKKVEEIIKTVYEETQIIKTGGREAVYRNRKSSMEYASPLNSCDDNSSTGLNYNSYNQRPQPRPRKNIPEVPSSTKEPLPSVIMPEFSPSDNSSSLDCDPFDANASLKDMFKTIDPTASPFC